MIQMKITTNIPESMEVQSLLLPLLCTLLTWRTNTFCICIDNFRKQAEKYKKLQNQKLLELMREDGDGMDGFEDCGEDSGKGGQWS